MGFPSPAMDFIQTRLTPDIICGTNANTLIVETSSGYAVVEKGSRPKAGEYLLVNWLGCNYFARPAGKALITEDGEAIEGEALDDIEVIGVVTWLVNRTRDDEAPVM
ncbi:hypothetical protein [Atlantibacter hermannii]|uniref:hypothetical protein n=1 Tax=Atlantibacter hermannii TaxID=565 RepID=UPI0005C13D24|nr:hypothetical protein [Atlantibacter hermannii]KIU31099.1 hypothetical protein SR38_19545 [Atlantibacter hermannii]